MSETLAPQPPREAGWESVPSVEIKTGTEEPQLYAERMRQVGGRTVEIFAIMDERTTEAVASGAETLPAEDGTASARLAPAALEHVVQQQPGNEQTNASSDALDAYGADFVLWEAEIADDMPSGEDNDHKNENAELEQARDEGSLDFQDVVEHAEDADDFAQWSQELGMETAPDPDALKAAEPEPDPGGFPYTGELYPPEHEVWRKLEWRASYIGFLLDQTREDISTDGEAEEWLALKTKVAKAKSAIGGDHAAAVDAVIEAENAGFDFVIRMGSNVTVR